MTERLTGYKQYQVKLFQNNLAVDMGARVRANHKSDKDYTMVSISPYEGSREQGQRDVAGYVMSKIKAMPRFTTKHDAIIFGRGMSNTVYGLMRYLPEGANLDSVTDKLMGDDKEGYYIEFILNYSKQEGGQ